jgi:acylphosphatase
MQREAERLDIGGWVKNRPDGKVEAVAEGPRSAVDAIVAWCGEGPPGARVSGVETTDEDVAGESGFRIVY